MLIVDGVDAQEHEDDGLGAAAQHFHGVFNCSVRLWRNVAFHVILHRDAAKRDPAYNHHRGVVSIVIPEVNASVHQDKYTDARMPDMWKISAFK